MCLLCKVSLKHSRGYNFIKIFSFVQVEGPKETQNRLIAEIKCDSLEVLITRTYKISIILGLPSEEESRTSSTANKRVTVGRQPKRKYK